MSSPCYLVVDIKAFKGKGAASAARTWLRDAQRRLAENHSAMEQLKITTRAVPGRSFAAEVYRRSRAGETTLRWRWISGEHCTWEAIAPHVAAMPRQVREYYVATNVEMLALNAVESILRCECRRASALIDAIATTIEAK